MKAKIKNYKCVTPGLLYYVQAYDRFEALHIVRKKTNFEYTPEQIKIYEQIATTRKKNN